MRRRDFLRAGAGAGLLALLPPGALERAIDSVPKPGHPGRFLNEHEIDKLRALVDRLIPGPPEDPDPGGVEMLVPEAIDGLLGAFTFDPPLIHAGGPFSGRHGGKHDDFARFVKLDRHAELGWRIRLEGSRGIPAREFNGPVRGLQQIYRDGLAHLDERAGGDFAALPGPAQDAILSDLSDDAVQEFVDAAFSDTLDAMYGPPEYGGNRNLVGWSYTHWDGDTQPRGHSDAEVTQFGPVRAPLSARAAAQARRFHGGLAGRGLPRR